MFLKLHVVVESLDEKVIQEVQEDLKKIDPNFSCSPSKEQESLNNCSEFYATLNCSKETLDYLYKTLNNDFDGEPDDCWAYGFNTKMFNKNVYYLHMEA